MVYVDMFPFILMGSLGDASNGIHTRSKERCHIDVAYVSRLLCHDLVDVEALRPRRPLEVAHHAPQYPAYESWVQGQNQNLVLLFRS